jgi:HEAT repeat protein
MELSVDPSLCDPDEARKVIPALIDALHDPDSTVRVEVVRSLYSAALPIKTELGPKLNRDPELRGVATALRELLTDRNPSVRAEAARGLAALGPMTSLAVPELIAMLRDPVPTVREAAALALRQTRLSEPADVQALIRTFQDPNPRVRGEVLLALVVSAENSESVVFPVLVKGLNDQETWVRVRAREALGNYRWSPDAGLPILLAALHQESPTVRNAITLALSSTAGPSWKGSIDLLRDEYQKIDEEFDKHLALILGRIGGEEGVTALLEMLDRNDVRSLGQIATGLSFAAPPTRQSKRAVEAIVQLLKCDSAEVRRQAILALQGFGAGARPALPALSSLSRDGIGPDRSAARAAIKAIEKAIAEEVP